MRAKQLRARKARLARRAKRVETALTELEKTAPPDETEKTA